MIGHAADHIADWALSRAVAILADRTPAPLNVPGTVGLLIVLVVAMLTIVGIWQVGAWL